MRINHERAKQIARDRGKTLTEVLREAGVSRTAYYSLARRSSVVPRSITALAEALDVDVSELLEDAPAVSPHEARLARARAICADHPEADFHNVWHTLALLELAPVERLNRSLRRGRVRTAHI